MDKIKIVLIALILLALSSCESRSNIKLRLKGYNFKASINDHQIEVVNSDNQNLNRRQKAIIKESGINRLETNLTRAIILRESSGNSKARSPKNAAGIMQVKEFFAKHLGYTLKDMHDDPKNIQAGTRHIREALDYHSIAKLKEDAEQYALREYNCGRPNALANPNCGLVYSKEVREIKRHLDENTLSLKKVKMIEGTS